MPENPTLPGKAPALAKLDEIVVLPDAENFTEATVKYETPGTRQARETRAAANAAHERLLALLKLSFAGLIVFGFFCLGVYLFAFKPSATEAQKLYASTVLTAIASGSAGYAFGKKEGKADKE